MNHNDIKTERAKDASSRRRHRGLASLCVFGSLWFPVSSQAVELSSTNDYSAVDVLFTKHCLDCHAAQDPEGKLVMESFDDLMRGGETGPVIVPAKARIVFS